MPSSSSSRTCEIPCLGWPSDLFFVKAVQKHLRLGWKLIPYMTGCDWVSLYYCAVEVSDWPGRQLHGGNGDALARFFERWDCQSPKVRSYLFRLLAELAEPDGPRNLSDEIVSFGILRHPDHFRKDGAEYGLIGRDDETDYRKVRRNIARGGDKFDAMDLVEKIDIENNRRVTTGAVRIAKYRERKRRLQILSEWKSKFPDFQF